MGCCCGGKCSAMFEKLLSDTIKYSILKKDNLDFSEENIIGELVLAVKKTLILTWQVFGKCEGNARDLCVCSPDPNIIVGVKFTF